MRCVSRSSCSEKIGEASILINMLILVEPGEKS
jgi:hypothetical protein